MQVHSVVALLYIWFVFPIVCSHVRSAALPELMEWLVANGAKVHQGMTVGFFEHGGAKIRGVYDSEDLAANTPLLVVPRTLAIELSHFPAFSSAGLPSTTSRLPESHGDSRSAPGDETCCSDCLGSE